MGATPHADVEALRQWAQAQGVTLTTPSDAAHTLRVASMLIDDYLKQCATTPTPEVLTDATCTQAAYWITNTITPGAEDVQTTSRIISSAALLSGSMSFGGDVQETTKARNRAGEALCFEARLVLSLAGARPAPPIVIG